MIKTLTILARRDDWTHEEFAEYWQEIHGPIARDVKQIRRYVQSEFLEEVIRKDIEEIDLSVDGIAEVWYDSIESMWEARQSPEGKALLADGAKFIGRARTLVLREREFIPGEGSVEKR
ncbi:EthD domain-containing protein [Agrobacterium sp. LAD9]|uniref:EthD domain-containing protein n=1 Tax=Agrobacterium sp. LAD9 TaxID=2055153 RepID=UPI000D1EF6D8|nr:EthD domain-containing protein [Agrobacterium sp. LAD9]